MAVLLRASSEVKGITRGPLQEKVSLYADDTLLYLRDDGTSLQAALSVIDKFGHFSGICVNWGKSVIFPLHSGAGPPSVKPLCLYQTVF